MLRIQAAVALLLAVQAVTLGADPNPDRGPRIFWSAEPVMPGQTAMLQGTGWDERTQVTLLGAPGGDRTVPPVDVNPRSLRFVIPPDVERGVYPCEIRTPEGTVRHTLNAPQPWWWQADGGRQASPGGWLRVFGRCLALEPGDSRIELRGDSRVEALPLAEATMWSLTATLPDDMKPGQYGIWIRNAPQDGPQAWAKAGAVTVAAESALWKDTVFPVEDFGAVPDDEGDDSAALADALEAAAGNGGGIVRFPRGRFRLGGGFLLPPGVLLQGAGTALTHLAWADVDEPPDALLWSTTGRLGIEDLSLYAYNYRTGVLVEPPPPERGQRAPARRAAGVRIRRVRVRFTPLSVKGLSPDVRAQRRDALRRSAVLRLRADDVQLVDCDLAWTTGVGFYLHGSDVVCRGVTALAESGGWCPVGGGRRIICEGNRFTGITAGATRGAEIWFAHNRIAHRYAGFREGFTTDGTFGGVGFLRDVAVDGCRLTFTADAGRTEPDDIPAAVRIVEGTGAGQFRRVVSFDAGRIAVDRPFDPPPDETSLLWAANAMRRHIYYDNDVADTGIALQLYGAALECIAAENQSARSGGFRVWGNNLCWYVQFLGNRIAEGYGTAGPEANAGQSAVHVVGPYVRGYKGITARGVVIRDNVLENHATITLRGAIDDVLVEHNTVQHSPRGIVGDLWQRQHGVLLRGNRFEDVDSPLFPPEASERYRQVEDE